MNKFKRTRVTLAVAVFIAASPMAIAASSTAALWHPVGDVAAQAATNARVVPTRYQAYVLDITTLRAQVAARRAGPPLQSITLPLPEGGFSTFQLSESGAMPAELAGRFPSIQSYRGSDGEGRRLRLDISAQGLTAAVYGDEKGDWLVQPADRLGGQIRNATAKDVYWSFRKRDVPDHVRGSMARPDEPLLRPGWSQAGAASGAQSLQRMNAALNSGSVLYDFTLAIAVDSSYARKFGGTVAGTLGNLVAMVNRLNEVYERDLGVHFRLSRNADKIIYTKPETDPYRGMQAGDPATNQANAANLAKVLGEANYDVGHLVMGSGGGGSAYLAGTCIAGPYGKASASTGHPNPVGDPFVIDYVAHELGHQFGASHSFNGCLRPTLEMYALEPGSGSTIMGYAGICGVHDLQNNSDAYFHADSVAQIQDWLGSAGGSCATRKLNQKAAPYVDSYALADPRTGNPYVIPARTPFTLNAEDAVGAATGATRYTWEQMDSGPEQVYPDPLKDVGEGPLFRSLAPSRSPARTFPQMMAVLGYVPNQPGEVLPTRNRTMTFRMTVRDNLPFNWAKATGPSLGSGTMKVRVLDTGAPFALKSPAKATRWKAGSRQQLAWNVAGTDKAPISCKTVRVELSTDGGLSFLPDPLQANAPNTGVASVKVPANAVGKQARLRVSCNDQLFFAVSRQNFEIHE